MSLRRTFAMRLLLAAALVLTGLAWLPTTPHPSSTTGAGLVLVIGESPAPNLDCPV